jgi:hypothetical protein
LLVVAGGGVGLAVGAMFGVVAEGVHLRHPQLADPVARALMLFGAAWLSLPAGRAAKRLGSGRTLRIGLLVLPAAMLATQAGAPVVGAVLAAAALGMVYTCALPVALWAVPAMRSGVGLGLYYGGVCLAVVAPPFLVAVASRAALYSAAAGSILALVALTLVNRAQRSG